MKIVPLLLGFSLVANAALVVVALRERGAEHRAPAEKLPATSDPQHQSPSNAPPPPALAPAPGGFAPAGSIALADLLKPASPEAVRDALRAAGISPRVIRALVTAMIAEKYEQRFESLRPGSRPDPARYWRQERPSTDVSTMIERNRVSREMAREIESLLGTGGESGRGNDRYTFLDEAKRLQLESIDRDYAEIGNETNAATMGFTLRSDRDMQRMLQEERRADIAALLTPEEFVEWERRTSPTTSRIRSQYGSVLETEEEFLAVYELQKAFDDRFNPAPPLDRPVSATTSSSDAEARRTAEQELRNQINALLGPERLAQIARERDPDYRTMQAATARLGLPASATPQVFELRARISALSQEIAADTYLDQQRQKDALIALAATAREQLSGILGSEGTEAFVERTNWIRSLERGVPFSLRPEGGVDIASRPRAGPAPGP